jgi:hypothetical protein
MPTSESASRVCNVKKYDSEVRCVLVMAVYFPIPNSRFKKERIFGNLTFRVGGRVGGLELRGGMVGSLGIGAVGPVGTGTGAGTGTGGTVGSAPDGVGTRTGAFGIGTGASTGDGTGAFGTGADGVDTGALTGDGSVAIGAFGVDTGAGTGGCTGGVSGADGATLGRMYIPAIMAWSTLVVN